MSRLALLLTMLVHCPLTTSAFAEPVLKLTISPGSRIWLKPLQSTEVVCETDRGTSSTPSALRYRSVASCTPVNPLYPALENNFEILSEFSDGSTRLTRVGQLYSKECNDLIASIAKCTDQQLCVSYVCIPVEPRYTSLASELVRIADHNVKGIIATKSSPYADYQSCLRKVSELKKL